MGGLIILHPQPSFRDLPLPTPMNSHCKSKFNQDTTRRRQKPAKQITRKRDPNAVVTESPVSTTASKNLVMGQVKILKRGEALEESLMPSKDVTSTGDDLIIDREVSEVPISGGNNLQMKNVSAKHKMSRSGSKTEDIGVSSTRVLGSNTKIVKKQMKNMTEYYAGYGFVDSPSPSLVPLPRFFINSSV